LRRSSRSALRLLFGLALGAAVAAGAGCTQLRDYSEPPPSTKKEKGHADKPPSGPAPHVAKAKPKVVSSKDPKPKDAKTADPKVAAKDAKAKDAKAKPAGGKAAAKTKDAKLADAKAAAKPKDEKPLDAKPIDVRVATTPPPAKDEPAKAPQPEVETAAEKAAAAKAAAKEAQAKAEAAKAKAKARAEADAKARQEALIARGKAVFESKCTTCHDADPHDAGTLGPDVWGSSWELLEAKVIRGIYPKGHTPKRGSRAMLPIPEVKDDLSALAAYLNAP
jgi:cytochrome c5